MEYRLLSSSSATRAIARRCLNGCSFTKHGTPSSITYSAEQTWDQYKITGRYQQTADQREMRDHLNVAWQILKELEGEERLESEEGAYLNNAKSSINDKADHPPLIQLIYQEVAEGKLIDPTVRVYIEKGFWNADFEIKFRQHYEREEEEQEKRETERRIGKEAPGSSTDYTVPHSMVRDKARVRTWKIISHKTDAIEQHYPKFWEDVQAVRSRSDLQEGKRLAKGGGLQGRIQGTGPWEREDTRERTMVREDTREDARERTMVKEDTKVKTTPRTPL